MMPAQVRVCAEASLKPPPTPQEFLERLKQGQTHKGPHASAQLYGATYAAPPAQSKNTERLQKLAIQYAVEFERVCQRGACNFGNLDDWMVAFA